MVFENVRAPVYILCPLNKASAITKFLCPWKTDHILPHLRKVQSTLVCPCFKLIKMTFIYPNFNNHKYCILLNRCYFKCLLLFLVGLFCLWVKHQLCFYTNFCDMMIESKLLYNSDILKIKHLFSPSQCYPKTLHTII